MKKICVLFALMWAAQCSAYNFATTNLLSAAAANVAYPGTPVFIGATPLGWTVHCTATGAPTSAVITITGMLNATDSPLALGTITLPDSSTGTALYTFGFKGTSNDQYFGASLAMTGGVNPTMTCIMGY